MVHEAGADAAVSLKRLHLFTHPSLLYGVIDKTRPARFLQRNLSYALSRKHAVEATGSELRVRLDGVAVSGKGVPPQVTLLVVLAEAASTGRDFKPVRAAAVALDTGVPQPGSGGDDSGNGAHQEGEGEEEEGCEEGTGGAVRKPRPRTVCLPLPKRPLTRPVLLLLASDHHPQLQGLQPESRVARLVNTDLRPTNRKLLGLLSDPCIAWAALQPLDAVLGAAEGAAIAAAATNGGSSSAKEDERGRRRRQEGAGAVGELQLQRCRLTRSTCCVSGGAGRTLTTHLLNVDRSLSSAGQQQMQAEQAEGRGRAKRSMRSSKDGGAAAAGEGAAPALPPPADDQAAVVESFAVCVRGLRTVMMPPASCAAAAAAAAAHQDSPDADEGSVVEFRYVFDDASWAAAAAEAGLADGDAAWAAGDALKGMGTAAAAAAANASGSGGDGAGGASARADWMQEQLANIAAKEAAAKEAAAAAAAEAAEAKEADQHQGRKKGGRGGAVKQGKEQTQAAAAVSTAVPFKERFFSEELRIGPGGACRCLMCPVVCAGFKGLAAHLPASHGLYRYICTPAAPAGPPQPALTAEGGGGSSRRGHGAAKGGAVGMDGGAGDAAPAKERRHVVEVRLPAEAVDFARRDLKTSVEDVVVLAALPSADTSPGAEPSPRAETAAVPPVQQRLSWRYVRRAGMRGPVLMRGILSRQVAARLGIPDSASGSNSDSGAGSDSQQSDDDVVILDDEMEVEGEEGAAAKKGKGKEKQGRRGAAEKPPGKAQPDLKASRGRQAAKKVAEPPVAAGGKAAAAAAVEEGANATAAVAGSGATAADWEDCAVPTELVQVTVEAVRRTIVGDALKAAAAGKGADAVAEPAVAGTAAAAGEPQLQPAQRRSGGGAAAPAAAPRHPPAHVLPPSALAPGIHPPGRRYFHCRSAVPGLAAEMFGPYDSDDDTDDEEWEAAFDRHMTTSSTRMYTPLSDPERAFFKLWSAFARRRPLYADFITRKRCLEFAREHGPLLRADPGLRSALALHLLLLREMNLVDPRLIARCLQVADGSIAPTPEEDERFLAIRVSGPGSRAAGAAVAAAATGAAGAAPGAGNLGDDDDRRPPGAGSGTGARRGGGGSGPGGAGGAADPDAGSGSGDDDDGGEFSGDGEYEDEDGEEDAMEEAEEVAAAAEASRGHKRGDSLRGAAPRGQPPGPRQRRGGGSGGGAGSDSAPEGPARKTPAAGARGAAAGAGAAAAAGVAAAALDGASVEAESPVTMEGVEGPAGHGNRDGGAKKDQLKAQQPQQRQLEEETAVTSGPAAHLKAGPALSLARRTKLAAAAAPPLPPRPLQGRHAPVAVSGKGGAATAASSGVAAAGGKENVGAASGRR